MEKLQPSTNTFTVDQIRKVWRQCKHRNARRPGSNLSHFSLTGLFTVSLPRCPDLFYPIPAQRDRAHSMFFSSPERDQYCRNYCQELFAAVESADGHFESLDLVFSKLLAVGFVTKENENSVVDRATKILSRLPASPPCPVDAMSSDVSNLSRLDGYTRLKPPQRSVNGDVNLVWNALEVVCSVDTNLLRIVLNFCSVDGDFRMPDQGLDRFPHLALEEVWSVDVLRKYVDTVAELLETVVSMSGLEYDPEKKKNWFLVKACLWTSWQRSVMVFFWYLSLFSFTSISL